MKHITSIQLHYEAANDIISINIRTYVYFDIITILFYSVISYYYVYRYASPIFLVIYSCLYRSKFTPLKRENVDMMGVCVFDKSLKFKTSEIIYANDIQDLRNSVPCESAGLLLSKDISIVVYNLLYFTLISYDWATRNTVVTTFLFDTCIGKFSYSGKIYKVVWNCILLNTVIQIVQLLKW